MLISARHRNDGGLNGRHVNKGWQKMKHFFVISFIGLTLGRFWHPLAIFFRVRNTFFGRPQRWEVVLWISESRILNSIFAFLLSLETKNLLRWLVCKINDIKMGGGRNVEFHYYDWQFFSEHLKWLLSWSQLRHHNVKNGFWVDHYIEKNEKNIEKISFVWISHFDYLWRKYLWHFGVNKNFLTWLNLTSSNLT